MVYIINIANKEATKELGIQESVVIEKYMIDVESGYTNEKNMIEILQYSIKSAIEGFNRGSEFSDEETDYLKFEDLRIEEKISFLSEILSYSLNRFVGIYKYQSQEEDLVMTI